MRLENPLTINVMQNEDSFVATKVGTVLTEECTLQIKKKTVCCQSIK